MRGACVWSSVRVPMGEVADWSRAEVLAGLAELERVQREVSAAMAGLVIALGIERRDTAAVLARTCGVSSLEARNRAQVAEVVSKLPAAGAALAAGALSAEHVRALGSVASTEGVVALLNGAGERSPEELARQAMALRMEADHGESLSARQRARRCVRFFAADDAMVGVRVLLGPVEGAELRSTLMRLTDEAWKRDQPDRAQVLGSHGGDPYEARMADALVVLMRGRTGPPGSGHRCRPAVIVTVTLDPQDGVARAEVVGQGPIAVTDAFRLADDAELYGCVLDTKGEILRFGRNRRLASHTQRLAVIARDRHCQYQRCTKPYEWCEVHHLTEWSNGGLTNIEDLTLICTGDHHHIHLADEHLIRGPDGRLELSDA